MKLTRRLVAGNEMMKLCAPRLSCYIERMTQATYKGLGRDRLAETMCSKISFTTYMDTSVLKNIKYWAKLTKWAQIGAIKVEVFLDCIIILAN